jgi:hypothetical protein
MLPSKWLFLPIWVMYLLALVAFEVVADVLAKQFALNGKLVFGVLSLGAQRGGCGRVGAVRFSREGQSLPAYRHDARYRSDCVPVVGITRYYSSWSMTCFATLTFTARPRAGQWPHLYRQQRSR